MNVYKITTWTLVTLAAAAAAFGLATVSFGLFDVAATTQHTGVLFTLLERTLRHSVQRQARDLRPPANLDTPQVLARGAACFRDHCVRCHGAPGVAREPFAMALQPLPDPLAHSGRAWRTQEIYWIVRHGIKMSGMPAWEFRLPDQDLWALAAFVARLPQWSPQDYARRVATVRGEACPVGDAPLRTRVRAPADPERGRVALYQYACNACHVIPGVVSSDRQVGPPLEHLAQRALIAGELPNDADSLAAWLRDPHSVDPLNAMPNLGVTDRDARDMAAYLETLN